MQSPIESKLDDEEQWRNGKRLDQLYVSPSNPVVPEIYDLGSRAEQEANKQHSSQLEPQLTGNPSSSSPNRTSLQPNRVTSQVLA